MENQDLAPDVRRAPRTGGAYWWAAVSVVLAGIVLLACSSPSPADGSAGAAAGGQALVEERCSECHALTRVQSASKTRDQWEQTVSDMIDKGARLSEEEQAVVVDYLAEAYGP